MALTLANIREFCRDQSQGTGSAQDQRNFDRLINDACRAFHGSGDWHFDKRMTRLVGEAAKSDGTISVSAGGTTVTGDGTAFASGDVGKFFRFAGQPHFYRVATYVGVTQVTIETYRGESNLAAGTTYTLTQDRIALPSDFRTLYRPRADEPGWELEAATLDALRAAHMYERSVSQPSACAVEYFTTATDGSAPTAYLWVYPSCSSRRIFDVPYYAWPKKLSDAGDGISAPEAAESSFLEFVRAFLLRDKKDWQGFNAQLGLAMGQAKENLKAFLPVGVPRQKQAWSSAGDPASGGGRRRLWPAPDEPRYP